MDVNDRGFVDPHDYDRPRVHANRLDTSDSVESSDDDSDFEETDHDENDDDDDDDADWNLEMEGLPSSKRLKTSDETALYRKGPRGIPQRSLQRKGSSSNLFRSAPSSRGGGTARNKRPTNGSKRAASPEKLRRPARISNLPATRSMELEPALVVKAEPVRQCFGPSCTRQAASSLTKYCSKKCGLAMALKRLDRCLFESRKSWYPKKAPVLVSVADHSDRARLKEVRMEQLNIHNRLIEAEEEHQKLKALIIRGRDYKLQISESVVAKSAAADMEEVEQMEPVVCVTCSSEIHMRHALRHMEKCFQKMESSSLLCSNQKDYSRGTPLFCDAYDSHAKAYCKRLRSVCEHVKEAKVPSDTICGCPLVENLFINTDQFCATPRLKCTRHFGWEGKRRAKIDVERYRLLIRMDELLQEEARLQHSLSQRAGILGMILHQTVDEEAKRRGNCTQ